MTDTTTDLGARRAATPEEIHPLWEALANAGDLEGLVGLYEADATVVAQPGQPATGVDGIQEALGRLLAMGVRLSVEPEKVLRVGDIALLSCTWTATGTAPDGSPIGFGGRDGVIARRQADGGWRMVIDDANFVE